MTAKALPEILACPKCKKVDMIELPATWSLRHVWPAGRHHYVRCFRCNHNGSSRRTPHAAINAWNRKAREAK